MKYTSLLIALMSIMCIPQELFCAAPAPQVPVADTKVVAESSDLGDFFAKELIRTGLLTMAGLTLVKYCAYEFAKTEPRSTLQSPEAQAKSCTIRVTRPTTTLDSILGKKPQELEQLIDMIDNPESYKKLKVEAPQGILLHGPPGTGKTQLARAIAHRLKVPFVEVCGSNLESKWVGENSQNIVTLYEVAKAHHAKAPKNSDIKAVVFIDEVDSIAPGRDGAFTQHHSVQAVNTLLAELTKPSNKGTLTICATNLLDRIDDGFKRSGRMNMQIHVKLPDLESRRAILEYYTQDIPLDRKEELDCDALDKLVKEQGADVIKPGYLKKYPHLLQKEILISFDAIAQATEGLSGADIKELCEKAKSAAAYNKQSAVKQKDFYQALGLILASKKAKR